MIARVDTSLIKILIALSAIFLTAYAACCADLPAKAAKSASGSSKASIDSGDWEKVVAAAKKEGKIVIASDPSQEWRKILVDMFRQEYPEIAVEHSGLSGRDFWPRVRKERKLGKALWDLQSGGVNSSFESKNEGLLAPIRPLLRPDIADDSRWIGGLDSLFYDTEKKFLPAYHMYLLRSTYVNHDFIKESEIKSSEQLLDAKFKGRIVSQSLTGGNSLASLINFGVMYGEGFVRELLSKQDLVITGDKRQQAEWVVRGKYPIALGFQETQLVPFVREGLGRNVKMLEDKIPVLATGSSGISLLKDAPHPNAAQVYINWLLSKNTQIMISKSVQANSLRTDVPIVVKELAVDTTQLSKYYRHSLQKNYESAYSRMMPVIKESLPK